MDTPEMIESRREAAIKLGLTPDQVKGLEAQARRGGEQAQGNERPIVPMEKPLPSGDTGRYRWRQTNSEVEIIIPIEDGIKTRGVAWVISETTITVGVKGREALKDARLAHTLKKGGGHVWQIDREHGERCILVTLEKNKLHEEWLSIEEGAGQATSVLESAPKHASDGYTPTVRNTAVAAPSALSSTIPTASTPSGSVVTWGDATVLPDIAPKPASADVNSKEKERTSNKLAEVERELCDVQEEVARLQRREAELQARQHALKQNLANWS
eukprot:TRINITY_DN95665_c0_g1_i1.p1 TRINITY_DN95665_c0_g1~~TRINITY_DN95665_c0_g1_i1.p1  ORF type:complete len:299 (-),score=54.78 TRINITY_DN95665_c0_g1_i1:45-857(-)